MNTMRKEAMKKILHAAMTVMLMLALVLPLNKGSISWAGTTAFDTSEGERYSNECSATFSKYPELKNILGKEGKIAIPGLQQTHIRNLVGGVLKDEACEVATPQGITVVDDYLLLSAYCGKGKNEEEAKTHPSVLYVIDKNSRQYITTITLYEKGERAVCELDGDSFSGHTPSINHVGGIAYDGSSRLFIAKSNDRNISVISKSRLISAVKKAKAQDVDGFAMSYDGSVTLDTKYKASFLAWYDNKLFVGVFNKNVPNGLYGFTISGENGDLTADESISYPISGYANGAVFFESHGRECLAVTRSPGRDTNSELKLYEVSANASSGKKINFIDDLELPPMAEEMTIDNGLMYTAFESASSLYSTTKYADPGKGVCKDIVDCICVADVNDVFKWAADAALSADESTSSTAGAVLDSSTITDSSGSLIGRYKEVTGNYVKHGTGSPLTTGFAYSDSMLMADSTAGGNEGYTDLAKAGVALASAAYQNDNVFNMLSGMEYAKINQYNYSVTSTYEDNDRVAFSIAQKIVYSGGKRYVLYVVPVRGTYDAEWYSDFNLGESGTHEGFRLACDQVIDALKKDFFESDGADSSTRKIFITGHSRGAAVGNLLAGELNKETYVDQSGVFAYTFACPNVSKTAGISYRNIYNYNYKGDLITAVPLDDWDYNRNGMPIEFSPDDNASRRFQTVYGETFAGDESMPTTVINALKTFAPTEADFHNEDNLLMLDILAYVMNEHHDPDDWEKILRNHGWGAMYEITERIDGLITGPEWFHQLEIENDKWTELSEEIPAGRKNWNKDYKDHEEYGSTNEERWEHWKTDHTELRNKIEKYTSVTINEVSDLDEAEAAVDERMEMYKSRPVAKIIEVSAVFSTTDNDPITPITHGHTPENYVTAMNSRYFGYEGWTGSDIKKADLSNTVNHGIVKGVGAYCFSGCSSLNEVTIPDGGIDYAGSQSFAGLDQWSTIHGDLKINYLIGESAFDGCSGIREVIIGDRVESIPVNAFNNCSGLQKVTMPVSAKYTAQKVSYVTMMTYGTDYYYSFNGCSNVEEINFTKGNGEAMQYNWDDYNEYNSSGYGYTGTGSYEYGLPYIAREKLKTVTIGEGVSELPEDFLKGCSKLENVSLPDSLRIIGGSAFSGCKLSRYTGIPDGVVSIDSSAFYGCTGLVSAVVPDGVTELPDSVFGECTNLVSVTLPGYMSEIGSAAFRNTGITSITVPSGIETIPESCFEGCGSLAGISLPETLTSISGNAFANTGLTELVIPDKVESIAADGFKNCSRLQKVTIPISTKYACYVVKSVSMMNNSTDYYYSFSGCSNISEIRFTKGNGETTQYNWNDFSEYNSSGYGSTGTGSYEYGLPYISRGSLTTLTVDEGITELPVNFVRGCSNLVNVSLPGTLKIIGAGAFSGCILSGDTVIPAGVEEIGESAFYGCTGLVSISIAGVSSVPSSVFNGCTSLTSVIMPDHSTEVGSSAFKGTAVENMVIPQGVTTLSESCFEGCGNLVSVTLPESLTSIGRNSFLGSGLQEIVIPDSVESIATDAFKNCSGLKKVSLPVSAKYSCYMTVSYGTMYTDRNYYYSFSGCSNVEEIHFTKGNGEAMQYTWSNESSSGYQVSGSYTYGLPYLSSGKLTTVIVEDGVTEIAANLLYGCGNIETLTLPDTLKTIGSGAFYSCSRISAVMLLDNIEAISSGAFPSTVDIYTVRDCAADTFAQSNGNKVYYICDPQIIAENDTMAPEESQQLSFTYVSGINDIETPSEGDWKIASATSDKTLITSGGLLTIGEDEEGPVTVEVTYKGHTSSHKAEFQIQRDPRKEALKKLNDLIAECDQIAISDIAYTVESFTAFTEELARAKTVASDESATEEELITAREELLAAKDGLVIKVECPHEWGEGSVVTEATCTDDGAMTYTCAVCGETKEEIIPALGHDWDEGEVISEPTETESGEILFTCKRCGETMTQQLEPVHEHEPETHIEKATLTKDGVIRQQCRICGEIISEEIIPHPDTFRLAKTSYTYTGKEFKPAVTVNDANGKAIDAGNYNVTYSSNKSVGQAKAVVKFNDKYYTGTKTLEFKINPKGTKISKLVPGKKSFKAIWKKQTSQTTGYQIRYSLKSNMTGSKKVTISKKSTVSKKITKLKAKKKYYVQIRTYKTVGGKKYYSDWSAKKSVKTK